jgi:diadenosine tetraphosphate (Ap4A) HIT family hydrolase
MKDSNYPWFILVPDREDITEIHQLNKTDQQQLITESSALSRIIDRQFNADKINIAALGNLVPQLHVHHIVRYRNDAAWPAPVWGKIPAKAYTEEETARVIDRLKSGLSEDFEYLL